MHKALSCLLCAGTMSSALYSWRTSFGTHEEAGTIIMPILQMRKLSGNLSTVIQPVNDRPESHIRQPGANLVLLTTELRCLREGEGHSCRENLLGEVGSDLDGCWEGYSRQSGPTE